MADRWSFSLLPLHAQRRQLAWRLCQLGILGFQTSTYAQTRLCGVVSGYQTTSVLCSPAAGNNAALETAPGTVFETSALASLRAVANNASASITLDSTSIINSPATAASGVQAQVTGSSGDATIRFQGSGLGSNSIALSGAGQDGVSITNAGAGTSRVTVNAGTALAVSNTVVGNEHDGIDIANAGGGNVVLQHAGTGTISVVGGNAIWLKASGGNGNIDASVGAGVQLQVFNLDPGSLGNHAGIQARSTNEGATRIDNSAAIISQGTNGHGIYLSSLASDGSSSTTGAMTVLNRGRISTNGLNGFGIRVAPRGGNVDVQNEGRIDTTGANGHGIYVSTALGSGNLTVVNNGALNVGSAANAVGSRAIYMIAVGTGDAVIKGSGDITVLGSEKTQRSEGITVSALAGNTSVDYSGRIKVQGDGATGIRAHSTDGNVDVNYTGSGIETTHSSSNAIYATTDSATGTVKVQAQGALVTHADAGAGDGSGMASFGIQATSRGADVSVVFGGPSMDVNGSGAAIVAGNAYGGGTGAGALTVQNSGSLLARGNSQQGIRSFSTTGAQSISNTGSIQTMGAVDSQGILADANGAAQIHVVNSARISTVGDNASGIEARSAGGAVTVANALGGDIAAGWGRSAGVSLSGASQTLQNAGAVQALSDTAIRADAAIAGSALSISNTGGITGGVSATTSSVDFTQAGSWSLRNFADTDGDGVRDRLAVAASDFGSASSNSIRNSGTVALLGSAGQAVRTLDTAGQYLPFANTRNAMALDGPVQGHILGVGTFSQSGAIDLTTNRYAGDVLVISGGHMAGQDGGGSYIANGGALKLDAVLNAGGPGTSQADILVLDSARLGSAPTGISVNNLGGAGAKETLGNGIALVEVLNKQGSAADVFTLSTPAVAGVHEYLLYHGGNPRTGGDPADGNWYLRSEVVVPPPEPPPVPPTPDVRPLYRPEVGAYLSNRRQASGMFLHSLHDRLGELQFDERPSNANGQEPRSGWLRVARQNSRARSADDLYHAKSQNTLIQGGGDILRWSDQSDEKGRWYVGGMLGYGRATTDADAQNNVRKAHSTVEGWNIGAYGTWFQDDATKLGAYVDLWATLGLFNSRVNGEKLPEVKYHARSLNLSGETGYAMRMFDSRWIVEPQAQLILVQYNEDDITEPNGTRINGNNGSAWVSRLGLRTYGTWTPGGYKVQPFLTLNWWHDNANNALSFNTATVEDVYPNNRYEAKLGVHATLSKGWTAWANAGYMWGKQGYKANRIWLGAKYTW